MADSTAPRDEAAMAEGGVAQTVTSRRGVWGRTFAALRHRNYRLWFMGQLVSMIGTWMQMSAQGFLVFELTRSTAYLGYVGFAAGLPSLLLMLYGGVVADRVARRKLLLVTQSMMMLLAFTLAALTFSGLVQPWHIVLLALLLGTANAFDAPAAQAFVFELVEREDVSNAIALNATLANLATVVGPTVAGLTYAAFGAAWCFTLNGISFFGVLTALLLMRLAPRALVPRTRSALEQVREGLRYTFAQPLLLSLLAAAAVGIVFVAIYATLLPAWSVEVLGGNAATNGLLQSARGAGSLVAALMLAAVGHQGKREGGPQALAQQHSVAEQTTRRQALSTAVGQVVSCVLYCAYPNLYPVHRRTCRTCDNTRAVFYDSALSQREKLCPAYAQRLCCS